MHVRTRSKLSIVIEMLDAVKGCANILIKAEEDYLISFDDQVVPTALKIIGNLVGRASAMSHDELDQFLAHIRVDGPRVCQDMIQETVNHLPPIMHQTYLEQKLIKPPSP